MILYGYWRSSASWRVRIALAYKGIAYETRVVNLVRDGGEQKSEAFREINPMRQVPALVVGDLAMPLTQSTAILEYLEETHPEPALLPNDPVLRARVRAIAEGVNSGIQPLQNLLVLQKVKSELQGDEQAWAAFFIERGLRGLEDLASHTAGRFLVGDTPTFADVFVVPQLFNGRRFGVDVERFPTLLRAEASCNEIPAFTGAHPDRQADAPR